MALKVSEYTRRWPLAHWYWGDAIAVDGLLAVEEAGMAPGRDHVLAILQRWLRQVPAGYHDALGPGAAIARLVGQAYLPMAALDRFLDAVDSLPLLYGVVPILEPHLPRFRFGVCIDVLYHLPPALAAAGRLRQEPALLSKAVLTCSQILDKLRSPDGWAQWYDVAEDRNNGVAWSRGAGWAILGVLDTLNLAEGHVETGELRHHASLLIQRLVATQGPTGHWGPILGRSDLADESSVAAFFLAAVGHPRVGVAVPAAAIGAATTALLDCVAPDGVYQGVSADVFPDWNPSTYERFAVEASPWGQGAALRALAAIATSRERATAAG